MASVNPLKRVLSQPGVCGGRPCIAGTRIEVSIILSSLSQGLTSAEIVREYPALTADGVRAAIAYAAERVELLDRGRVRECLVGSQTKNIMPT